MSGFFGFTWGSKSDPCVANCVGRYEDRLDDISRRCSSVAEQVTQWHVRETELGTVGWFSDMFGRRSREVCLHGLAFDQNARQLLKDALNDLRAAAPDEAKTSSNEEPK